jgi:hypothetical protein
MTDPTPTGLERECDVCHEQIDQVYSEEAGFSWQHRIPNDSHEAAHVLNTVDKVLDRYLSLEGPCNQCHEPRPVACVPVPGEIAKLDWYCRSCLPEGSEDRIKARSAKATIALNPVYEEAALWALQIVAG